jgi:hypothetical protein
MNIVTNVIMLKYFKRISIFKVDLGSNLKGATPSGNNRNVDRKITIKDAFIKQYQLMNKNGLIRKYGEIGTLKFYEDGDIKGTDFHIYDGEQIYEITATEEDMMKDPGLYLSEILQMLENNNAEDNSEIEIKENMIKDITYTNMDENIERPNMKLPKDQYIQALIDRRHMLEKNG